MPAITLYGRRWHFSSDIIPLPAAIGAAYSLAWLLVMLLCAAISHQWPRHCQSHGGVQYVVLFSAMFAAFAATLVITLLLIWHGLQGAPFEVSKRRWVPRLLYCSTAPLALQLVMAVYGAYVCTELEPDCWEVSVRSQVTNFAQALVFTNWAFLFFASVGLLIFYNMYPNVDEVGGWEDRCRCIATLLCCHHQIERQPEGKRPPIRNIAELTAGLLSHVDLDASDLTAALVLTSAAQNRRRRLRVAKALLPVYRALRDSVEGGSIPSSRPSGMSRGRTETSSAWSGSDDGGGSEGSVYDVPSDRQLTRALAACRARDGGQSQPLPTAEPGNGPASEPAGPELETLPESPDGRAPAAGKGRHRRGASKTVTWQVLEQPEVTAAAPQPGAQPAAAGEPPPPAAVAGSDDGGGSTDGGGSSRAGSGAGGEVRLQRGSSLALTEENVAALARLQRLSEPAVDEKVQAAAQLVAGEILEELPEHIPGQGAEIVEQLAETIEAEIFELGGDELAEQDVAEAAAAVALQKSQSLDPAAITVDPDQPSIWFPPSEPDIPESEHEQQPPTLSSSGSHPAPAAPPQTVVAAAEHRPAAAEAAAAPGPAAAAQWVSAVGVAEVEAAASPFATAAAVAGPAVYDATSPPPAAEGLIEQVPRAEGQPLPATATGAEAEFADAASSLPPASSTGTAFVDAASGWGSGPLSPAASAAGVGSSALGTLQGIAAGSGAVREGVCGKVAEGQQAAGGPQDVCTGGEAGGSVAVQTAINIEAGVAAVLGSGSGSGLAPAGAGGSGSRGDVTIDIEPVSSARSGHSGRSGQDSEEEEEEDSEEEGSRPAAGVAPGSGGGGGSSSAAPGGLGIERQLTLKYPVVITPSEHVDDFRGPLPADALADIYAGRHDKVPAAVLQEATQLLKFSYAVYYLQPRIEHPVSCLDAAFCCARQIDPQEVVLRGMSELGAMGEEDSGIELLHLNCSNRVLAHLPYMIALDHTHKAVVLAIRGTISVADVVTDAIVYPEPLDEWLPQDIKQKLDGPAFAHAGMVAAARAIFEDMTQRRILQPLMHEEQGGFDKPPQQQDTQGSRGSAPTADGGSGSGTAAGASRGEGPGGASSSAAGQGSGRGQFHGWEGQYDAEGGLGEEAGARYLGRVSSGSGGASGGLQQGPGTGVNRQSGSKPGAEGRLWEGESPSAAQPDSPGSRASARGQRATQAGGQRGRAAGTAADDGGGEEWRRASSPEGVDGGDGGLKGSAGREVGSLMRRLIEEEGWQFIVQGHSLGAGAAALVSLKLREHYPGLKCVAYSVPGGLVSKNLAHAMAHFTTSVVIGKDAVPRMSVATLGRLMDEMVTALARCRQPKLKVLCYPWWRRNKRAFREMFYGYREIPPEPLDTLRRYYESRRRMGQPLSMYPPGRVVFLRPIKTRREKQWDAVWISPEDIIGEGILVSPHVLTDHLCSTAFEALTAAKARAEVQEEGGVPVQGSVTVRKQRRLWPVAGGRGGRGRGGWRLGGRRQRHQRMGSLTQVLIDDSM